MTDTTEPAKAPATESEQWQFGINVPPVETHTLVYAIRCGKTTIEVSEDRYNRWLVWRSSSSEGGVVAHGGAGDSDLTETEALLIAKARALRIERERLLDIEMRQLADIVAAFRRKLTDTEPETAMPDTRFEPCSDERPHSPHQIDRGAFGRKTCPGVHADDADPQPATVAEPGPPVRRLCADGRPHQAHVNGVWRCPGVDTDARIQLEAEDARVRELIAGEFPSAWLNARTNVSTPDLVADALAELSRALHERDPQPAGQAPVTGYTKQPSDAVQLVNFVKGYEGAIGDLLAHVEDDDVPTDPRMIALARNNLQQGFMWLVRAVFQPESRL